MTPETLELRDPARRREPAQQRVTRRERDRRVPRRILCRACRTILSDREAVFAMKATGASGVFVNPHGFLHEVLTVRRAESLFAATKPSTDFTWFPGYAWEIVFCATCRAHVGWRFSATGDHEPAVFWGLRLAAIVEDGEP